MIILDLFDTHHEKALKEGAVDSADQLNEYIPRRKDANYAEFAPGTRVKHNLLGPRVGTVVDVLAIPREDRRESGIPVQVGDRIYWMAPQGLVQVKGMAEGNKKKKKKKKSSQSLRGYFFPGYAYYGAGESGEGGGDGGGGESIRHGVAEGGPYDLPGKDYDRPGDIPRKQSSKDHNPYPYSPEEDDDYFREIFRKKREADKAKAQSGSLNELSTQKLAQYKTAAAADAKKSDAAGNYSRGDRRFRGINQATIKQFANDAKTHASTVKEQSSAGSDAVEQAILKRIMVSHTDLLMQFGPEKVMQAAEEVAYNAGDVDDIGTSDVSAYVRQVRQILGAE